jgi:hypothetical protein
MGKQIRINYNIDEVRETLKPMFLSSYEKTVEAFEMEASVLPPDKDDPDNITFEKIFGISSFEEYYDQWLWDALVDRVGIKYLVTHAHLIENDETYTKQLAEASAIVYNKAIPTYQEFMKKYDEEYMDKHGEEDTDKNATIMGEVLPKQDTFEA